LHFFYTLSHKLPPFDFLITAHGGELSSTVLTHTHEFKGAIGQVLALVGAVQLRASDAGGAYVGTLPAAVLLVGSLLIILMLVLALVYFVLNFVPLIKPYRPLRTVAAVMLYAVASFALIKTAIDGGILTPAVPVTLAFIWLFWHYRRRTSLEITTFRWLIGLTAAAVVGGLLLMQTDPPSLALAAAAALAALYVLLLVLAGKEAPKVYVGICVVLFIAAWVSAAGRDMDIAYYASLRLEPGRRYFVYDEASRTVQPKKAAVSSTIGELARQQGKNISYSPISSPGVTCFEKGAPVKLTAKIVTSQEQALMHLKPTAYIRVSSIQKVPSRDHTYSLQLMLDACTPEPLSTLNGYFMAAGIDEYVLINPNVGDGDAGLG
jgi:hypothetical protein